MDRRLPGYTFMLLSILLIVLVSSGVFLFDLHLSRQDQHAPPRIDMLHWALEPSINPTGDSLEIIRKTMSIMNL